MIKEFEAAPELTGRGIVGLPLSIQREADIVVGDEVLLRCSTNQVLGAIVGLTRDQIFGPGKAQSIPIDPYLLEILEEFQKMGNDIITLEMYKQLHSPSGHIKDAIFIPNSEDDSLETLNDNLKTQNCRKLFNTNCMTMLERGKIVFPKKTRDVSLISEPLRVEKINLERIFIIGCESEAEWKELWEQFCELENKLHAKHIQLKREIQLTQEFIDEEWRRVLSAPRRKQELEEFIERYRVTDWFRDNHQTRDEVKDNISKIKKVYTDTVTTDLKRRLDEALLHYREKQEISEHKPADLNKLVKLKDRLPGNLSILKAKQPGEIVELQSSLEKLFTELNFSDKNISLRLRDFIVKMEAKSKDTDAIFSKISAFRQDITQRIESNEKLMNTINEESRRLLSGLKEVLSLVRDLTQVINESSLLAGEIPLISDCDDLLIRVEINHEIMAKTVSIANAGEICTQHLKTKKADNVVKNLF